MTTATAPKKLNYAELAHLFVTRELARQLPREALQAALDAGTLWRGLRAEINLYADYQHAVTIRPDDVAALLPAGRFDALDPAHKKKLRAAIREEDRVHRQTLRQLQNLIDAQCASIAAGSPAFQAAYEGRLAEYLTETPEA